MAFDPMGNPGSEEPVEYAYDPYVAPEEPKKQRQKNLDWDKAFGMQRNPYAHTFKGPESPGGFGSVSSGGAGGKGTVADVGEFEYDKIQWDKPDIEAQEYEYTPFGDEYSYDAFTPVDQFQSPVEAVDFREFQAPTTEEAAADPGYQFRLAEGRRALENSASAKGMLRTGNTWKDLLRYGQGAASSEYDKVYGRRLGEHGLAYQQALQANQDRYGRALGEQQLAFGQGAQAYGLNRQNQMDMYDRGFQRHQANQMGLQGAQQLGEASGLGAQQANFGVMAGLYDRGYAGQQAAYEYDLQRAMQEAAMQESAAGRAASASAANMGARERQFERQYDRAADEWARNYDVWNQEHARRARAMSGYSGTDIG